MPRIKDLTGLNYGLLTVIQQDSPRINKSGRKRTTWLCQCKCGKTKTFTGNALNAGDAKSCGCTKHNMTGTKEHTAWKAMKTRCYNNPGSNYEKNNIQVCDRWLNNFKNFLEDMGLAPSKDHSIERIDNLKGYSADNCIWGTHNQQALNRGKFKNNSSGYKNIQWHKQHQKWYVSFQRNKKTIFVGLYKDLDTAITERDKALEKWFVKLETKDS